MARCSVCDTEGRAVRARITEDTDGAELVLTDVPAWHCATCRRTAPDQAANTRVAVAAARDRARRARVGALWLSLRDLPHPGDPSPGSDAPHTPRE